MTEQWGGGDFDPVEYYNQHRKVQDDAQLSEDEAATLRGMEKADIDDLIDIDWRAWKLQRKLGQAELVADAGSGGATIKRVGATSY